MNNIIIVGTLPKESLGDPSVVKIVLDKQIGFQKTPTKAKKRKKEKERKKRKENALMELEVF